MHVRFDNVNDAFRGLVSGIHDGSIPTVRKASRNGCVIVVDEPVTITYKSPTRRVLFNAARDANPFMHLYEALWMLAGRNDVAPLAYYAKRMESFSDDGKTLNGAYGHRWRRAERYERSNADDAYRSENADQLDVLVNHLKADPNSRRAVLQMWNVEDDLLKIGGDVMKPCEVCWAGGNPTDRGCKACGGSGIAAGSKDVCCNLSVMFSLRRTNVISAQGVGKPDKPVYSLDMTVTNRSNDLIWGLLGANYVHFTFLQEYVAARLGAGVGRYHHFSNNLHVYDDPGNSKVAPWKPAEWLAEDTAFDEYNGPDDGFHVSNSDDWGAWYAASKTVPLVRDPEAFERELPLFVETYSGENPNRKTFVGYTEPFLLDVAQPMMWAFYLRKMKETDEALLECGRIKADDWRLASEGWINRRKK